ncbi:MAG TPA: hypothetical protein DCE81_07530, partial [Cytophagales bacterium]|nr:hypothetical protein [Cytophagales bacterium]
MNIVRSISEYHSACQQAIANPEGFWAAMASGLTWRKRWSKVL